MLDYEQELDKDLPVDIQDQYFLPNSVVPLEVVRELLEGCHNHAYMNWLKDEIQSNRSN